MGVVTRGAIMSSNNKKSNGKEDSYSGLCSHFEANKRSKEYVAHQSKVHSVGWSCDGSRLASGSFDKSVTIWSLESDRLGRDGNYKVHTGSVDQLRWHPSKPEVLVTASGDKTIRVWDTRAGKPTSTVTTKGENINICWSPDGHTIAVGNKEDLLTFIDARTLKTKHEELFKYEVNEISWNRPGDKFFLTNGNGCVVILSWPEFKHLHTINAHPANCICIEFDKSGKYYATGSADALTSLWDVSELVCLRTFSRLDWPVRTLSFSHDSQMIASASEDLFIDIAHVQTGQKVHQITTQAPTFTVAWHPKKHLLVYACDDKDKHDRDTGGIWLFGLPNTTY
ncbi:PREDICTED: THO complex subunit 3-like isoform X2 [Amphimedon queenslandica]|nr:PREDICTED: THO complex subunit 3-like isoform X2 [Amphimedon queenslandica]|eukprot:XP_003384776.2 PREDICTED: THO complex subunit 3-like isoform X2 [Amphimedon queenslandica]